MKRLATLLCLLALSAFGVQAQTFTAFGAVLSGANEVPPNSSNGTGIVSVLFADNPTGPDGIVVVGGFDDLEGGYSASHLHFGAAGTNGPIAVTLNASVDADTSGGEWEAGSNTFPSNAAFLDSLQMGRVYVNVHSSTFPGGELRGQLVPIPLLDGDLTDTQYQSLAVKQNTNSGFGPDIDVTEIVYYADLQNEALFLGIKGELNTASSDGIGLWLDFAGPAGVAAGTPLGVPNAGHYMGADSSDFAADFEVDFMFAINPGGTSTDVFFDVARLSDGVSPDFLGSATQDGLISIGPDDGTDNNGGAPPLRTLAFAFDNSGTGDTGLEFVVPFDELGISVAMFVGGGNPFSAFTFVVSSTAFFSDVTVPGDITTGNPGFNTDFSSLAGGPFFATGNIPVELTAFDATVDGSDVRLAWTTASETNNAGFEVQMRSGETWGALGFVEGHGTTTEAQTYGFTAPGLAPGTYAFRLKQVDYDGQIEFSPTLEVAVGVPGTHTLSAAYPNPFNPSAQFSLSVARDQQVTLTLHDVLGRTIATLFEGRMDGGQARLFTIDGADLPSGVYTYRAVGETFSESGRVTLLK